MIKVTASAPTVRIIANFSQQHLKAAVMFRDQVVALENQYNGQLIGPFFGDIRSFGSGCIMSAAASLEALINELFIAENTLLHSKLKDFDNDFWGDRDGIERKPILEKYQIALEKLGVPVMEKGDSSYQDARWLIELRNALVHYKPIWDPEQNRTIKLEEALAGRFSPSPFYDSSRDFVTMKCMGAGCAKWVVTTALSFIRKFDTRTNLDPQKMMFYWEIDSNS